MSADTAVVKTKTAKLKTAAVRPPLELNRNYSVPEAAAAAGVAAITLWRAIYAERLRTYRIGRRRVVSGAQIKTWLDEGGKTAK